MAKWKAGTYLLVYPYRVSTPVGTWDSEVSCARHEATRLAGACPWRCVSILRHWRSGCSPAMGLATGEFDAAGAGVEAGATTTT